LLRRSALSGRRRRADARGQKVSLPPCPLPLFARSPKCAVGLIENPELMCYYTGVINIILMECIFCKIAKGEAPAHKIWKNEKHLAFLSIFPNTEGFSVVITKEHYPSYVFDLPEEVLIGLVKATKQVVKLLDAKLEDVGRTGMIFEGFGVDHVHSKLFPMHGTKMSEWKPLKSKVDKYFEKYEGYVSSHDYKRMDDEKLAKLARKRKE